MRTIFLRFASWDSCTARAFAQLFDVYRSAKMCEVRKCIRRPRRLAPLGNIIEDQIAALQDFLVQKTERRSVDLNGACGILLFVKQVQLIPAYLLRSELLRRLAEIFRKLLDGMDVQRSGRRASGLVQTPLPPKFFWAQGTSDYD